MFYYNVTNCNTLLKLLSNIPLIIKWLRYGKNFASKGVINDKFLIKGSLK